jgi:D-inositol-3-phosphate glycosyltransferase
MDNEEKQEGKKIKILWISDAVTPTGFSRVSHSIIGHLPKDKYDIAMLGINYWGDPHGFAMRIYPASIGGDVYGLERLEEVIRAEIPDIIFLLNDIWVIKEYLKKLKAMFAKEEKKPKIVLYFPVDGEHHDEDWYSEFDIVSRGVVYSEFGKKVASFAKLDFDFEIIPHGVDTGTFFRMGTDRKLLKEKFFSKMQRKEILIDSFIVLNANRNQPRKRIDITIEAFAMFAKNKPDNVHLYLHMGILDAHIDLYKFIKWHGLEERFLITSREYGVQHVVDSKLNWIYNVCDVGVNTSLGEGWGLVNIEHAVTGAPQVVPANSVQPEIYGDCGLLTPTITKLTTEFGTIGYLVRAEDVAENLEKLYTDKILYQSLAEKSVKKFSGIEYSWEEIAKKWDKLFTEVAPR